MLLCPQQSNMINILVLSSPSSGQFNGWCWIITDLPCIDVSATYQWCRFDIFPWGPPIMRRDEIWPSYLELFPSRILQHPRKTPVPVATPLHPAIFAPWSLPPHYQQQHWMWRANWTTQTAFGYIILHCSEDRYPTTFHCSGIKLPPLIPAGGNIIPVQAAGGQLCTGILLPPGVIIYRYNTAPSGIKLPPPPLFTSISHV